MEGGTSYNGFHGGESTKGGLWRGKRRTVLNMFVSTGVWRAAHIDDLRRSKDMVSDIKALQNMTISQMFERKMSSAEGN